MYQVFPFYHMSYADTLDCEAMDHPMALIMSVRSFGATVMPIIVMHMPFDFASALGNCSPQVLNAILSLLKKFTRGPTLRGSSISMMLVLLHDFKY
jgi:hypothetical protein